MRLARAAAHAAAALTLAVAAASGIAAFTAVPAGAAVWDDDGGLVFTGDDAALPTAPTDVWSALRGRSLATLGTGGAGPSSCVIDTAGEAVCTGWSGRGQLGIGTKYETGGPAAVTTDGVLAGTTLTAISSGAEHACAIDSNGAAYCWGASNRGQVGSGTTRRSVYAPTAVSTSGALAGVTLTAITAGGQHSCALSSTGAAYCWGRGAEGRLGNGSTADVSRPAAVDTTGALSGKTLVAIDAGTNHTCALDSNGAAYCWGAGRDGQLGDGTASKSATPVKVAGTGRALPFAQISAGLAHTCALTADIGNPYCWGTGANGRLGTGTTDDHVTPVAVAPFGSAVSITTGDAHTCVVTVNLGVDCWGLNDSGQLGTGDKLNRLSPTQAVDGDIGNDLPATVTATADGTCALGLGGTYHCWGRTAGFTPETTSDLTSPTTMPTAATVLDGQTITALTDDALHTCALTGVGDAYCWGYGLSGELGTGRWWGTARPTAVDTTGALAGKNLVDITAGEYHTCALDSAGKAYCWGMGNGGQIGDGDGQSRRYPRAVDTSGVLSGKTLLDITAGDTHTCALDDAGKAYCWGSGYQGQLGTGMQEASLTPVAVSGSGALKGKVLVAIDAGYQHTCALSAAGKVFCWGNNYKGQLGDGTMTGRTAPVAVDTSGALNGETLTALTAGDNTTCVLDAAGQAFCWGDGWSGQVGDGNALEKNPLPVAVDTSGALTGVQLETISAGGRAVCAVSTDGFVFCWGSSYSGQLGNGSYDAQARPVTMHTEGALSGARVTLLGTSGQTWMVTEQR